MERVKTHQIPSNLRYQIGSVMVSDKFAVYSIQGEWRVVDRKDYDKNLTPAELSKLATKFSTAKGAKNFAGI